MGNVCMLGWRKVSVEDRRGDCGEDPGDDEDLLLLLLLIYVVYMYKRELGCGRQNFITYLCTFG